MTPMPIVEPTCQRNLHDFNEYDGLQPDDFPAEVCADAEDNSGSTVGGSEVPTTCAPGLVCDDVENCGTELYEASMVCGGELCPNAVELWETGLMSMHKGMAIHFSGDVELDFVRGMIPHHLGAVDMCSILVESLMCNDFGDVGGIDGMVHFCNHVRKEQAREVSFMESWLESAGFGQREDCPEGENAFSMSDGGCGDTSSPSSVAFIEANHAMHAGMGIRISCDHSVDFVRSMIPHHAGAVRMCEILQEYSDESSLDSVEIIAGTGNIEQLPDQY
jgi:uncharacterized protein (DUF305 family)